MNYGYNNPSYVNPMARNGYGMQQAYPQQNYPMQQQMVQQVQDQQQNVISENNLPIQEIRFCTSAEAIGYVLFPNKKALLIDKANGLAYLKWTDNQGFSSIKSFVYREQDINNETQNSQEKINVDNFVTKEQTKDFIISSDLEPIKSSIVKLQKDMEQMTKLINLVGVENGKQN